MRVTLLMAATLGLTARLATAEPPDAPPQGRRPPIERLAEDLQLDDYQKGEVEKILEAQHAKMQAAREEAEASGTRLTRGEMKGRHEQMQQETLEQLKSILTEEQLQKFQTLMKERRRGPPGPPSEDRTDGEE